MRRFAQEVANELDPCRDDFSSLYAPRVSGLGFRLDSEDLPARWSWAVVAQWLTGYAIGAVDAADSLADAERWFLAGHRGFPHIAPEISAKSIAKLVSPAETYALLPYLLDPLSPGTRRSVLKSEEPRRDRQTRKSAGVYYTPADVASFMAATIDVERAETCLDPACGSGVFLRAALSRGMARRRLAVFGCDIDPLAAEQCAFVLLATEGAMRSLRQPWATWHLHRMNLATVDSLLLDPGSVLGESEQRIRGGEIERVRTSLRAGHAPSPLAIMSRPKNSERCFQI